MNEMKNVDHAGVGVGVGVRGVGVFLSVAETAFPIWAVKGSDNRQLKLKLPGGHRPGKLQTEPALWNCH